MRKWFSFCISNYKLIIDTDNIIFFTLDHNASQKSLWLDEIKPKPIVSLCYL